MSKVNDRNIRLRGKRGVWSLEAFSWFSSKYILLEVSSGVLHLLYPSWPSLSCSLEEILKGRDHKFSKEEGEQNDFSKILPRQGVFGGGGISIRREIN